MNTPQPATLLPKSDGQRIIFLDILRGIAVLFIYVANIGFFSGHWFFPLEDRIQEALLPSDEVLDFLNFTFVDGKFYSIFSLLFGIGCMVQYHSWKSHNKPFLPFFKKRMFWLLVFGLIHLCLFWAGDILTLYALLGFLLVYCIDFSDKKLITWAIILILLPLLNWAFINILGINYPDFFRQWVVQYWEYFGFPINDQNGQSFPKITYMFQNQSLSDFFTMNLGNWLIRVNLILAEGRIFKVFGIFLIGLWAGRQILQNDLLNNTPFLKKIAYWGIGIGLPFCIFRSCIEFFLSGSSDFWSFMNTLTYALGVVPMAMGYSSLLALIFKKKVKFLYWFAPVGKMAFSNYIFQTLLSILIFYGIGFAWAGKLGFTYILCIALVVFTFQIIISSWWLQNFRFGPLEWLWRSLTYQKIQPFKKIK